MIKQEAPDTEEWRFFKDVIEFFRVRKVPNTCLMCKNESWRLHPPTPESYPVATWISRNNNTVDQKESQKIFIVECMQCGFQRMHAMQAFDEWKQDQADGVDWGSVDES